MNADAYQTAAARTLIDEPDHAFTGNELMLMWCGLGLGGESGEILDLLKKGICHQHGLDTTKLIDECGDLLWYLSGICTLIGVPLSEVMGRNVTKLKTRYPNGYASADSKARVDVAPAKQTVRSLLDQHNNLPTWIYNAVFRHYYGAIEPIDDNADRFLEIVRQGKIGTLKSIGAKGMEILQKELLPPAPDPPVPIGRKADILSALQYYGPLTARQLESKLNKPANYLTPFLTSMYRNGEVARELVQIDDTNHRYYRYTAFGADCQPITRGATPYHR